MVQTIKIKRCEELTLDLCQSHFFYFLFFDSLFRSQPQIRLSEMSVSNLQSPIL